LHASFVLHVASCFLLLAPSADARAYRGGVRHGGRLSSRTASGAGAGSVPAPQCPRAVPAELHGEEGEGRGRLGVELQVLQHGCGMWRRRTAAPTSLLGAAARGHGAGTAHAGGAGRDAGSSSASRQQSCCQSFFLFFYSICGGVIG